MKKFMLATLVFGSVMGSTPAFAAVVCSARNLRGGVFREVGIFPGRVQARAMASCRAVSLECHPIGCR